MALKWVTNYYKGNNSDQIAINPAHVVAIYDTLDENKKVLTAIYTVNGTTYYAEENLLDVVARLNEKD